MVSYKLITLLVGLSFSGFVGHCFVRLLNTTLRKYLPVEEESPAKLTSTLGVIERIIYTSCVLGGEKYYQYAGIFFGLKIAQRLIIFSKIDSPEKLKDAGQRANAYFICNILSLVFGVIGALLIHYLWNYGPK